MLLTEFYGREMVMNQQSLVTRSSTIQNIYLCCPTKGAVTLALSDMRVTRRHHDGWTPQADPLYSTHSVGLYIIISVPSKGITLIWDKHTRITVELHASWRVSDEDSEI